MTRDQCGYEGTGKCLASRVARQGRLPVGLFALALLGVWLTVSQPSCSTSRPSAAHVAPDRLREHVVFLSETCHPRDWSQPVNLDRAAAYIAGVFRETGGEVAEQPFEVHGRTYRNVCVRFGPVDGPRVIVGAHYDACQGTPGADDNASGVAGLLELAGLLGRNPPAGTVELVAYTLEEPPFFRTSYMGSARHAGALAEAGIPVRAMIGLEMIGFFSDEAGSQSFPIPLLRLFYPGRGNFIGVVGNLSQRRLVRQIKIVMKGATDLPVHSLNAPAFVPGVDWSDHRCYWAYGFDAAMITDTAFLRNRAYHTTDDTADRLDYQRMAKVVIGVFEAVRWLAERSGNDVKGVK